MLQSENVQFFSEDQPCGEPQDDITDKKESNHNTKKSREKVQRFLESINGDLNLRRCFFQMCEEELTCFNKDQVNNPSDPDYCAERPECSVAAEQMADCHTGIQPQDRRQRAARR